MTEQTATQTNTDTPAAWIGCLHCYNSGDLVGRWFDLTDAEEVEIISGDNADLANPDNPHSAENPSLLMAVHAPHNPTAMCEELWVMDHENLPIKGECDPMTLNKIAEDYDEIETMTGNHENEWAAYCAYVLGEWQGNLSQIDASTFTDRYRGEWGSFQEYAEDYADNVGDFREVPDHVMRHFDWESYAEELAQDFVTIDHGGNVWVFVAH